MKIIKGDLLKVTKGIIAQQTNCKKVMGAGLALKIARKYPQVKQKYIFDLNNGFGLGSVSLTEIIKHKLYCACLFGQDDYGRNDKCYTQYAYLSKALHNLYHISLALNLPVYLPYGLGSGLAGGDWDTIEQLIKEDCPNATILKHD
jgi:O-acetyl-ADP-ribose deacetylase (regulator of RNase III)